MMRERAQTETRNSCHNGAISTLHTTFVVVSICIESSGEASAVESARGPTSLVLLSNELAPD
eukprot:1099341-Rhodomonas_salina.1